MDGKSTTATNGPNEMTSDVQSDIKGIENPIHKCELIEMCIIKPNHDEKIVIKCQI